MGAAIDTMTRGIYYSSRVNHGVAMSNLANHLGKVAGLSISIPFSPTTIIDAIHSSLLSSNPDIIPKQIHQLQNVVSLTGNMSSVWNFLYSLFILWHEFKDFYPSRQTISARGISNELAKQEFLERAKELPKHCNYESVSSVEDLFNYYFTVSNPNNVLL